MTTPSTRRKRSPNGFAMLVAVAMAAALLATVFAMQNLSLQQSLAHSAERDFLIAKQAAEAGLARVQSDALKLSDNFKEPDLDCLLDPKLDGTATTTDNNLPPVAGGLDAACSSYDPDGAGALPAINMMDVWADADATPFTISGGQFNNVVFRRVQLDMNGDGTKDAAYFVRYDDNRDDWASGSPRLTTNNNPAAGVAEDEAGNDEPLRDRDQNINVTVIGISGSTDPATARARRVLRATLRGSGSLSYVTPGRALVGGKNTNVSNSICGGGGLFCWVGESSGRTPDCACGQITANDRPSEVWSPMVPQCTVPTECDTCEPLVVNNLNATKGTGCPFIPMPQLPNTLNIREVRWMNNMASMTSPVCHFYISKDATGGARNRVYLWDRLMPGCNGFSGTAVFPMPDFATTITYAGGGGFNDCWMPIYDSIIDVNGGSATQWAPGANSNILALDVAGRSTLGPSTLAGQSWVTACGSPTTSATVFDFATNTLSVGAGAATPNGFYFIDNRGGFAAATLTVDSTGAPARAAVLSEIPVVYRSGYIRNPVTDASTIQSERYGIMSKGACAIQANSGRIDQGIWCEAGIDISANVLKVLGNMYSQGDITYSGGANNFEISGPNLTANAWPANDGACPSNSEVNGKNCAFKNGGIFCADIACKGNVEFGNGGTIRGTLFAEGNIELSNGTTLDPNGASMLGARPTIMAVQELGY